MGWTCTILDGFTMVTDFKPVRKQPRRDYVCCCKKYDEEMSG